MRTFMLVVVAVLFTACNHQIYKSPNFDAVSREQQVVAILPFEASIDIVRLPKGVKGEDVKKANQYTSYSVQKHAYYYLQNQAYIKRLSVTLQDINFTNELLEKAGISYEEMLLMEKEELCEKLGVDGVISGKIRTSRPLSDGAALITGLLGGFWGATNETHMTMTIHQKNNSQLIWRYSFEKRGGVGSSSQKITSIMIKKVARHFPYNKSRNTEVYY